MSHIVEICCNDGENGLFSGAAIAIKFGDCSYESRPLSGIKITDYCSRIRIHRREFKYISMKEWVGNWCWNSYLLNENDYNTLHQIVKSNGLWHESDI